MEPYFQVRRRPASAEAGGQGGFLVVARRTKVPTRGAGGSSVPGRPDGIVALIGLRLCGPAPSLRAGEGRAAEPHRADDTEARPRRDGRRGGCGAAVARGSRPLCWRGAGHHDGLPAAPHAHAAQEGQVRHCGARNRLTILTALNQSAAA